MYCISIPAVAYTNNSLDYLDFVVGQQTIIGRGEDFYESIRFSVISTHIFFVRRIYIKTS